MKLAKDYNSVMGRSAEIMKASLGLDFNDFESGSVAFDYEGLMEATGYTLEECEPFDENGVVNPDEFAPKSQCVLRKRWEIIKNIDVLIDGRYKKNLRDVSLHWRGSSNQRVLDIKKSLEKGEVVLWDTN